MAAAAVAALLLYGLGGSAAEGARKSRDRRANEARDLQAVNEPPFEGYAFSNVTAEYDKTPTGDVETGYARVRFHYAWTTSSYPGSPDVCIVKVYAAGGDVIGEQSWAGFVGMASESNMAVDVPIHGEPASAVIDCYGKESESQSAEYRASDVSVRDTSKGASVSWDGTWDADVPPAPQTCTAKVYDAAGNHLGTETVNLFLSNGSAPDMTVGVQFNDENPSDARVTCEPLKNSQADL